MSTHRCSATLFFLPTRMLQQMMVPLEQDDREGAYYYVEYDGAK